MVREATGSFASLERFAAQAALALRNATLYGESEPRRRAAEELARLARSLSDRLDPAAVAQDIVRTLESRMRKLGLQRPR